MSQSKYVFTHEYESNLSHDDKSISMECNFNNMIDLVDFFRNFALACGFEAEEIDTAFMSEEHAEYRTLYENEKFINQGLRIQVQGEIKVPGEYDHEKD